MHSSEAAESIVKLSLEGFEVAARITGKGAEKIAVALYTMAKDQKMTKGKTTLNKMLKSGSQLQIFSLNTNQLKKFHEVSKKYGVLYTALIDKKHPDEDGLVDIMVRAEDAPKINRIVDRFKLSAYDTASIKTEIEKDKMEEMIKDANERGVEVISDEERLADDIMSKPIQKEENEMSNPNVAKTEKSLLSEPSLENKSNSGVAINPKKPSVRETLKRIKEEIKTRDLTKEQKEQLKDSKDITIIDTDKKKTTNYINTDNGIVKNTEKWKKGKEK
ncbi:MAG: PcfB family protein [Bacilli bacterium]|nr:PcfB family protein [Bacilli bacterium]